MDPSFQFTKQNIKKNIGKWKKKYWKSLKNFVSPEKWEP